MRGHPERGADQSGLRLCSGVSVVEEWEMGASQAAVGRPCESALPLG